jgi:UDP-N-acetylglucosamine 2-epimerase (non-hydrolysing)
MDVGGFILAGIDEVGLLQAVDTAVEMNASGDLGLGVPAYMDENVSTKVVKLIQSYVGVVNKMIWRKSTHRLRLFYIYYIPSPNL